MTALSLLGQYKSSDDDDDDIDSNDVDKTVKPTKRLPTPQLPSYSVARSVARQPVEDPTRHQNRKRTFAHEPGNWATFVAIPVHLSADLRQFLDLLSDRFGSLSVQAVEDFHVSLTRVVVLRHHWIQDFVTSVKNHIVGVKPFPLSLQGLSVYLNDDKSRTFVALRVVTGQDVVDDIVDKLDECLGEYSLPKFYENRSYHLSVLWALGDVTDQINQIIDSLPFEVRNSTFSMMVVNCFCKTGNKQFNIPFS